MGIVAISLTGKERIVAEKMEEMQEQADDAQTRRISLGGDYNKRDVPYRRPNIRLSIDRAPHNDDCMICITINESMGQPVQWIELAPDDASSLARHLIELANYVEAGHVDGEKEHEDS